MQIMHDGSISIEHHIIIHILYVLCPKKQNHESGIESLASTIDRARGVHTRSDSMFDPFVHAGHSGRDSGTREGNPRDQKCHVQPRV